MKKIILSLALLSFISCTQTPQKERIKEFQNLDFNFYKAHFVERLWKLYPEWASSVGYHNYDSVLTVPDQMQREKELAFFRTNLDSLKQFDISRLSEQNKTDLYMITDFLKGGDWGLTSLKSYEWNPSNYNVCGVFAEMLNGNYDSLDTRLYHFYLRMASVPEYYEAAKNTIKNPTTEHTELAISQNLGGVSVFEKDLEELLVKSKLSEEAKANMKVSATDAANAVKGYADWLKKLKNNSPRSFRLGKELYAKKFEFDIQSGYTADQIYEKALAHKKDLHEKMFELTKELWPKYLKGKTMPENKLQAIKQMIDILSIKHVKPDSFQTAIEKQIPVLVDFVNKKNLLYMDSTKPLVVRKEPAYMAGLAGASISSPGPYDKNGNTYYNVGSMNGWTKERAESYLREYNHYILQILNIHEAIPGHYAQLIYSNQAPSIIKAILGNGAMIEGWAVYTERMMLENGYGASDGFFKVDSEMWLMYYKWNLRSTCNTILDYSVHTKNMSKEDALSLLTKEAFQQQAEAEGKWRRVTLSQVQLCSYFTGYKEIYDFREELKIKLGDKFNLKEFHETFLSYGSAPVKYIKELMLTKALDAK
ncbi:DUF885 domain-containing protein [Aurantibacillus circumpalustris]|uniref:DUF885 domain-containing protein n=1 Tax=Aurantibacillus circumpalustris TaxID=3036359 RepID=UPI00295B977F|nr:DUF885 domain-containing protein [Aurantibacillus circumpalustris]